MRDGAEQLGILVASKEGTINEVRDLNGKTIAFPAPNAFGASLMTRAELDRQKVKFQPLWAQTHTSAYLNVALGKADAAGGIMATLKQQTSGGAGQTADHIRDTPHRAASGDGTPPSADRR